MMKHQYKERLAGVRKIALLPLCMVYWLYSLLRKIRCWSNPFADGIFPIKAETPKVVLPEVTVDSAGNEKDFLLLDTPKMFTMYNQGMLTSFNPGPDSRLRKSQFLYRRLWIHFRQRARMELFTGAKYKSYRGYRFTG